jgi:hypothetical protein
VAFGNAANAARMRQVLEHILLLRRGATSPAFPDNARGTATYVEWRSSASNHSKATRSQNDMRPLS